MNEAAGQPSGEICHRCLQPVAMNAQRCPNCGERHTRPHYLPIFLGILGLLALVFVAIVMVKVIQESDTDSATPDPTDQSAPQTPDQTLPLNQ